jgi:hypothetical protein
MVSYTLITLGGLLVASLVVRKELKKMSVALDNLKKEVAETKTVNKSVLTLIAGLADQIRELIDDEDALLELANELDAEQAKFADVLRANTPEVTPVAEETPA